MDKPQKWSIQIVALTSKGTPSYELAEIEGTMNAMEIIQKLSQLPRPLVVGTVQAQYWLHPGDALLAVPVGKGKP